MQHPGQPHGVDVFGTAGDLVAAFEPRHRASDLSAGLAAALTQRHCHRAPCLRSRREPHAQVDAHEFVLYEGIAKIRPQAAGRQHGQQGSPGLDRRGQGRRRAESDQGRRAEGGDRRHRRHLSAQDGQPGGDVRRGARLPEGPSRHRQHPDLGAADQRRARAAAQRLRDGADPLVAQLHEERALAQTQCGQRRSAARKRFRGQGRQHRSDTDPGLARARRRAVHRHRLSGGDEGSRLRMDQLRHLPHPVAAAGRRIGDDVSRQARPHHHGQVPRARPALPGRRHRRHPPRAVHARGPRDPYGKNEIEAAGGILGEPIEVFNMPKTGLPVPANSEIAFEGFIHPGDGSRRSTRRMDRLLRRRQPARARSASPP